jgi:hypothetical protein
LEVVGLEVKKTPLFLTTHEMVLWEKQKLADILEAVADDFLDKAPLI